MKTKLTNTLRGNERKNRYAKLNRGRWRRFIYIKFWLLGKRAVGKVNKGINVENIIGLKKLKLKIIKKEEG